MRKMSYSHFVLFLNIRKERPFVVDAERKNAMLIWRSECCAVCRAVGGAADWL